jgi:hypothetical protein
MNSAGDDPAHPTGTENGDDILGKVVPGIRAAG